MSPIQFLPAAAGALVPLAARVAERVAQGLSFASVLATSENTTDQPDRAAGQLSEGEISDSLDQLRPRPTEHLRQLADDELQQFLEKLQLRLSGRVDTSISFELKSDDRGRVVVDGNHPQRAELESIFEAEPTLAADFRRLEAAVTAFSRQQDPDQSTGRDFLLGFVSGDVSVRFE